MYNGLQGESELTPFRLPRATATDKKAKKEADKFSGSFQQQMDCGSRGRGEWGDGLVRERERRHREKENTDKQVHK